MEDCWGWMLDATEGYCIKCGDYYGIDNLTMDHIVPLILVDKLGTQKAIEIGAIHHIDNVQVLCKSCNSKKHDANNI